MLITRFLNIRKVFLMKVIDIASDIAGVADRIPHQAYQRTVPDIANYAEGAGIARRGLVAGQIWAIAQQLSKGMSVLQAHLLRYLFTSKGVRFRQYG